MNSLPRENGTCTKATPNSDVQTNEANDSRLSDMTDAKFETLSIAPELHRALSEVFKYPVMTVVQSRTINVALDGTDILVKARTGTGKTLAFLLPTLHRIMSATPSKGIRILVISPTRELATQIAAEAKMTLTFVEQMTTQVVVGGTNVRTDLAFIRKNGPPSVLVATPGRLLDHLENHESGFTEAVMDLDVLVLDEADRLLDMGFAPDLMRILDALPPVSARQTLLFSATMATSMQDIVNMVLKSDHKVIDCVGEGESTHAHVAQSLFVTPIEKQVDALGVLLIQCMKVPDYKIIVFFTTARLTQFFAELFEAMGRSVLEIHSRKSQGQRNKVSSAFRTGKKLIMFTSDVTARGLDYPDVTTVIQVGLPMDKSQYIHRIGRTARAGKGGSGVLLLAEFEAPSFKDKASGLPLQTIDRLPEDTMEAMHLATESAVKTLPYSTKADAFQAWLGFYNSKLKQLGWTKRKLVTQANYWAVNVAKLNEPPAMSPRLAGRIGLSGIPELRVEGRDRLLGRDHGRTRDRRGVDNEKRGRWRNEELQGPYRGGRDRAGRGGRGRGGRGGRRGGGRGNERDDGYRRNRMEWKSVHEENLVQEERISEHEKYDGYGQHAMANNPLAADHVNGDGDGCNRQRTESPDKWQPFSGEHHDDMIETETW